MFWGATWGTCLDKFGVRWMFNYAPWTPPATDSRDSAELQLAASQVSVKLLPPLPSALGRART